MTDLLSPPAPPASGKPARTGPPLAGYGLIVAVWTAASGLITVITVAVAAWFAADSGTFGDAVAIGAISWLVANGGGLHLHGVAITLIPLGTVGVIGWLLYRGGRWVGSHATNRSWLDLALGTFAIGSGYCAAGVVVLGVTWSTDVHADIARTVVSTLLLALVFGGLGVLQGSDRGSELFGLLPVPARAALRGGFVGVGVLVAASAALVAGSLVIHFATAVTLAESLHSGLVGGAVMALVGLALVPNAVLFAGAFLAGPGVAVGSGTVVAPGDVSTGPLPAFPLLAAVPRTAGSSWWELAVVTAPIAAGAVAGLVAVRRYPVAAAERAAVRGGLAGFTAGVGFGLLTGLSGGAVGPGRMQDVGPYLLPTVVACAAACLLGGVVAALASRWLDAGRPLPALRHSGAQVDKRRQSADSRSTAGSVRTR